MNGEWITWINLMTHPLNGYLLYALLLLTDGIVPSSHWLKERTALPRRRPASFGPRLQRRTKALFGFPRVCAKILCSNKYIRKDFSVSHTSSPGRNAWCANILGRDKEIIGIETIKKIENGHICKSENSHTV